MIIDIPRKPEKADNTGSVKDLSYYLEKENKQQPTHKKEWFFSHDEDQIGVQEVIEAIDNNHAKLKNKDGKYYLINISPSQRELEHIGDDPKILKAYTRGVMEAYARNYNRSITGRDLMYFAKIEHERTYKGYDQAVKDGLAQQGDRKPGLQTHIHVIVARKDRYGNRQFSPLSNHRATTKGPVKGGFDRKAFYTRAEEVFDQLTGYERNLKETFRYRNTMKYGTAKAKHNLQATLNQDQPHARHQLNRAGPVLLLAALMRSDHQDHLIDQEQEQENDHQRSTTNGMGK